MAKTFGARAQAIKNKYKRAEFDPIERRDMERELDALIDEQEEFKQVNGIGEYNPQDNDVEGQEQYPDSEGDFDPDMMPDTSGGMAYGGRVQLAFGYKEKDPPIGFNINTAKRHKTRAELDNYAQRGTFDDKSLGEWAMTPGNNNVTTIAEKPGNFTEQSAKDSWVKNKFYTQEEMDQYGKQIYDFHNSKGSPGGTGYRWQAPQMGIYKEDDNNPEELDDKTRDVEDVGVDGGNTAYKPIEDGYSPEEQDKTNEGQEYNNFYNKGYGQGLYGLLPGLASSAYNFMNAKKNPVNYSRVFPELEDYSRERQRNEMQGNQQQNLNTRALRDAAGGTGDYLASIGAINSQTQTNVGNMNGQSLQNEWNRNVGIKNTGMYTNANIQRAESDARNAEQDAYDDQRMMAVNSAANNFANYGQSIIQGQNDADKMNAYSTADGYRNALDKDGNFVNRVLMNEKTGNTIRKPKNRVLYNMTGMGAYGGLLADINRRRYYGKI